MKILLIWLTAAFSCSAVIPAAEALPRPPHPTLVFAEHKGARVPVVAAAKDRAVAHINGKRESLPEGAPLFTERGSRYAPATATMVGGIAQQKAIVLKRLDGSSRRGTEFESALTVTASQDLPECYMAITAFDRDSLTDATVPGYSQTHIREIGTLKAGQPTYIKLKSEIVFPVRDTDAPQALTPMLTMGIFWQLFSGGNEVQTTLPAIATEFYYNRERMMQQAAVEAWKKENRTGQRAAQPLLQIPPLLGSTEGLPRPASATLTVGADGLVAHVVLDQPFPAAAEALLLVTLRAWLFLPAIKDGTPTAVRVRVPLQF